ncbi:MAG: SPOR domain-containing protein [Cellulophaga sp.]|uniref:SPOR domain-containing protein n=1 Tax=unclassified Cellulophaga TaxID=2634405 RepID=UPI0026E3182B|nr:MULTISPECIES: SPOR domain-containing protein [unclassified Cellulophaga]MDO6490265.1 SPOR domain-containing protein [Cellulophaga sp. 2_MG-2023]MDO6494541.1 SPOR domain-containing protein [Cellulophaga sp. 3_MG-2023]
MKTLYTSIICLTLSTFCFAQEGDVTIKQDKSLEKLLDLYTESNKTSKYYTIQIHSSQSPSKANSKKSEAQESFTNWFSEISFDQPNYKVRIGKFNTKFEAQQKLIEVHKKYPNAFLIADQKEK